MAGVMESLFGKKKEKEKSGPAMDAITGSSAPVMGGPGGTLSTTDLVKARADYSQYAVGADSSGGDRLTFEEYVQQVWKPGKK